MRRLASLVFAFVLAVPMSAYAATTETTKVENKGNPIKVSSNQLSEGVTFSLEKDKPVQVEFPDGQIETFTFKVEDVKNENGSRATSKTKRMAVERGYGTANLELSAYATYSGRSVSIDGDAYLDFWGLNTSVDEKETKVIKRTGSGNNYAKAGTTGTVSTTEPATGVFFTKKFNFEMWLDPANSDTAIINVIS